MLHITCYMLCVNTANPNQAVVALARDGFSLGKSIIKAHYQESEKLLPAIDRLLRKNKITVNELGGIAAVTGPGGFSSLRIGIAVANALGYAAKIPTLGIGLDDFEDIDGLVKIAERCLKSARKGRIVEPLYGKEPSITMGGKLRAGF